MRVTVLTGGTSTERDVALASAVQVVPALRSRGHEVAVVDTARGFMPEEDEPALLSGVVGTEPPSIAQLQYATPKCCSLHYMAAGARTGPFKRCWRW
jgi:hypothetical protein